jgi:hypothetical protein
MFGNITPAIPDQKVLSLLNVVIYWGGSMPAMLFSIDTPWPSDNNQAICKESHAHARKQIMSESSTQAYAYKSQLAFCFRLLLPKAQKKPER